MPCRAPSELVNVATHHKAPSQAGQCRAAVRHSLAYGGPFSAGPLFVRTCWICLYPTNYGHPAPKHFGQSQTPSTGDGSTANRHIALAGAGRVNNAIAQRLRVTVW